MTARASWLFYVCFALLAMILEGPLAALAEGGSEQPEPKKPKKLKIETYYEPAACLLKGAKKTRKGDELQVIYSGAFYTDPDTVFDTNIGKKEPLKFTLGAGKVMPGWDLGLTKMCAGERRRLSVPGDMTFNGEPALYTVELKSIKRPTVVPGSESSSSSVAAPVSASSDSPGKAEL